MRLSKAIFVVLMCALTVQLSAQNLSSVEGNKIQSCSLIENETGVAVVNVEGFGIPFFISPNAEDNTLVLEGKTKVGIGTPTPDSSLHVRRSDGTARVHVEEGTPIPGTYVLLHLETTHWRPRFTMTHGGTFSTWNLDILNVTGDLAFISAGGGPIFTFEQDGDFSIEGNFISSGQTLNVPDYVFADDYNLMPLDDVRAFIDAESHLPEIPSASEVQAEGLNITDMQLKLLQKIEELTLYTLDQHDTIAEQRQTIEDLQASVKALQADVSALRGDSR